MTTNKQLRELAEGAAHWSGSIAHVWPSDPDFNDAWTVGTIDEDGNKYPVIEVDADQYDAPGDSERLARFFTAANPATVLALLDAYETLQVLCDRLQLEAQCHAQEARTANATIAEIYRLVSGGTGEPGNWSGAEPVQRKLEELQAECEKLRKHLQNLIDQTTPLEPAPGNPMWSRRIQLDEVIAERDQLRAECEKLRKDAERLDWIVSEGAIVAHAGVRGEPHRYRVEWPLLGEVGINWFTSERDAIDAAMQEGNQCTPLT